MAERPKKALKFGTGAGRLKARAAEPPPEDDHGHSHSHDHASQPAIRFQERPVGAADAEGGGSAFQVDLEALLPGEADDRGRFAVLARELERLPGVRAAHLRTDRSYPELCVHFDETVSPRPALLAAVRTEAARAAERYLTRTWFVRDMDSAECAQVVEHVLRRKPGVLSADVAYAAERLVVEYDKDLVTAEQIEAMMAAAGYPLEAVQSGEACSAHGHDCGLAPKHGMALVYSSGALLALGFGLSYLPPAAIATPWLYAAALVTGGWYPAQAAFRALRAGKVDIEGLMVLAAIGAGGLGAWGEGAFLLFLFSLGHSLEHRAMERARRAIESLAKLRPDTARIRKGEAILEVAVARVKRGDVLVVRPGDRIALDGVVLDGRSNVDQATLTGESVPVPKAAGDEVFAGTVNVDGALEVEVRRLAAESTLAKLVNLVSQAEANKSPTQRLTAKIEKTFGPIVLVAAPLLAAVLYFTGTPAKDAVLRGVSLLVAASPCALAISTPAAVLSAVARAARAGVLIKGGAHLDALGRAQAVAFDKTGTLTHGKPRLVSVEPADGVAAAELLGAALAVEQLSAHPLAHAIATGAKAEGVTAAPADDVEAVHGKGIRGHTARGLTEVGSPDLFDGTPPSAVADVVGRLQAAGQTTMLVREGGRWLGVLGVADTLRDEAKPTLAVLGKLGVRRTVMLSGDNTRVAEAVAAQVGITEVRAPLLPEGKVRAIRELARSGGVAMVGDGVNDAPALATASVGIAMGGAGSDVALETADVVLMGDDLSKLPFAVGLSRSAVAAVRQNLAISLGVSGVLVIASIFGWVAIAEAVVLHEGSTILVVLNGLRLLAWEPPKA